MAQAKLEILREKGWCEEENRCEYDEDVIFSTSSRLLKCHDRVGAAKVDLGN